MTADPSRHARITLQQRGIRHFSEVAQAVARALRRESASPWRAGGAPSAGYDLVCGHAVMR